MKSTIKNWIMAIRPKTMLASIGPVIIGLSLAYHQTHSINTLVAILTLTCAILLQFSTNIANDYLDFKKGIDTVNRLGPIRVTSNGLISEQSMKTALIILLLMALLTGIYLMMVGGIFIIIIGLLSLYFSYGYTGGPYPLSYNGLGELSALIFFGLIAVTGTTYLQTFHLGLLELIFGVSVGLISAAILGINNLRDIATDTETKKRTLAVRIGEKNQRLLILFCIIAPQIINITTGIIIQNYYLLLSLIIFIPFMTVFKKIYIETISPKFNNYLARTAQYLFLYSLIVSLSFILKQ
jgi:1,4-dihydroxy-2-naphthoate octaprenyltransferase